MAHFDDGHPGSVEGGDHDPNLVGSELVADGMRSVAGATSRSPATSLRGIAVTP